MPVARHTQETLSAGEFDPLLHDREGGSASNLVQQYEVGDFDGLSSAGHWILRVRDRADRDTGRVRTWSVTIGG